jgi:hypothetical protein
MTAWMEYLYQQQPMPTNATGVPVTIDVIDANGNYRNIGMATSDTTGAFSLQWKPDIPGKYTVIATFAGTESYYSSAQEASFIVDPAAPTSPPVAQTAQQPIEMYIAGATIAIIIAVAIVGLVIVMILRKRP